MSVTTFYRAFEDRYRGDRDVIKQRLRTYAPFLDAVATLAPQPAALDLGCGRGEWLELLGEHGFHAKGVDLDAGMLAACIERGLRVELTDAVAALRACADNSLALVSAFHLVEHIPFEVLQALIGEALRVLQPGGLLIMETPNPENLSVGATSFYLDPSHEKPLPPLLLGFLTEFAGFGRQRTVRLQEPEQLHDSSHPMVLIDVLENVSPDYAIIAQKTADAQRWAAFDSAWQRDYGYSLGALAERYDAAGAARLTELHQVAGNQAAGLVAINQLHAGLAAEVSGAQQHQQLLAAELSATRQQQQAQATELSGAHHHLQALAAEMSVVHGHLADVHSRIDHANQATQQALAHAAAMHQQVQAMQNSNSWKLTAPYRRAGQLVIRSRQRAKQALRGPLLQLIRSVLRQPRLRGAALRVMGRFPGLKARLRGLLYQTVSTSTSLPPETLPSGGDLSPRAAQVYQELKKTLETRSH
jgi:O-antigen chain-terminating methyltransferase